MIPILFPAEADPVALLDVNSVPLQDVNGVELLASGDPTVARLFNTYGLGALTDCISCEVTEERNGEYELVMEYPMNGVHFDELELRRVILAKPNHTDEPQAFRIYYMTQPIDGVVTVNARHIIYDLSGIPVVPFTATSAGAACSGLMSNAQVSNPFSIGTQIGTIADFKVDVPSSVRSWFGGKEGSLIDVYGGEWWYDNYTCTLMGARGQDRGVVIRYGKNLIDFEQEKNCEEVYTGVLPYWYDEESGTQVRANIVNVAGVYDYRRILVLDMSMDFETKPTKAQLKAKAETYITANNIGVPKVNITLDWVQTSELADRVDLCDTVLVEFERLGVSAKAKCISTTWDVLKDRYSRIEFGEPKTNITDTIAGMQDEEKKQDTSVSNAMLRAINAATALITGNEGGYVVMHDGDGDGYPDELLIMDTPDISTATKVWRWNQNGLGYSASGYSGTFGLAMTADGEIVADYITTGTLSADRINGGTLVLGGADNRNGSMTIRAADNSTSVVIVNNGIAFNNQGSIQFNSDSGAGTEWASLQSNFSIGSNLYRVLMMDTYNSTLGTVKGDLHLYERSNSTGAQTAHGHYSAGYFYLYDASDNSGVEASSSGYVRVYNPSNHNQFVSLITGSGTRLDTSGYLQARGTTTVSSAANAWIDSSSGRFYRSTSSSKRYKHDITSKLTEDPEKLYDVEVVQYKYNDDYISKDDQRYGKDIIGFIAEEVAEAMPGAVDYDDEGRPEMWNVHVIVPAMMKLIQNQKKEIDELRARLDRLEARFSDDGR